MQYYRWFIIVTITRADIPGTAANWYSSMILILYTETGIVSLLPELQLVSDVCWSVGHEPKDMSTSPRYSQYVTVATAVLYWLMFL